MLLDEDLETAVDLGVWHTVVGSAGDGMLLSKKGNSVVGLGVMTAELE